MSRASSRCEFRGRRRWQAGARTILARLRHQFRGYVGLGAVRSQVVGAADRPPTAAELGQMTALVDKAMCDGALGLSTGLFYAPQSYARRDEVVALAKVAAARGGIYDSHIRDRSSYTIGLAGAVEEGARGRARRRHPGPYRASSRRWASTSMARQARSSRGSRKRRRRGRSFTPINIRGRPRAPGCRRRCCRAGRRTADARRCWSASTMPRRWRACAPRLPKIFAAAAAHRRSSSPPALRPSRARRSNRWRPTARSILSTRRSSS